MLREREVESPDDVRLIQESGVNLVTLARSADPELRDWSVQAARGRTQELDHVLPASGDGVEALISGLGSHSGHTSAERELRFLVRLFAGVAGLPAVRVRMAVVTGDECRRFHIDNMGIRLLCTWAGPGTEWIAESDLVRSNLDNVSCCDEDFNASLLKPGSSVRMLAPFAVGIFKGRRAEGTVFHPGWVHRSPPVAATGLRRIRVSLQAPA